MANSGNSKKKWIKKIIPLGVFLLLVMAGIIWYVFAQKFEDTSVTKPDFTVNGLELLKEFRNADKAANKKYAEKIVSVNGRVSEIESVDSVLNVKISDTATGDYLIFAFQRQDLPEVKKLKEGDSISIKGSCSGGTYSEILETEYVSFKRCTLNK